MITALFLLVALSVPTFEQNIEETPISPCPNVFQYEPPGTDAGSPSRWYGVINLSTDNTLHSLWLNIVLDRKADILGNWIGDVTTKDNIDFRIENTTMKINPGPATAMRFFVQYSSLKKAPRLQAIRLNGREICNANNPQPAVDRPDLSDRPIRRPDTSSSRPPQRFPPEIRPEDRPLTRPVQVRPSESGISGPVYVRPDNSVPVPSSIAGGGDNPNLLPNNGYLTTAKPGRIPPRRPAPSDDDVSSGGDSGDYFEGGTPTFIITGGSGHTNPTSENQCGKVVLNNPIPLVVNGTPTQEGQWPWQIALYQTQTVDNKYLCGGTLVSHRHVITAAHCVTRKKSRREVNKNTLTVYLGKHNLRTSVNGVQIRFVENIFVHPEYNASTYSRDVAILELREPVTYSDWVRPACLWPENEVDLRNVIGKKGSVWKRPYDSGLTLRSSYEHSWRWNETNLHGISSRGVPYRDRCKFRHYSKFSDQTTENVMVVGWGFDETGVATEELSLVEMPVVDQETCLRSYNEFFVRFTSSYTYCAGYRDGHYNEQTGSRQSTSVCNGDSGGGMVFKSSGRWYLRGLVSLSVARQNEYRCDPTHYVIFTDLAKFLPWIKQIVYDY